MSWNQTGGSGKTTILKMINRLVEPSEGRVRLGGEDVQVVVPISILAVFFWGLFLCLHRWRRIRACQPHRKRPP